MGLWIGRYKATGKAEREVLQLKDDQSHGRFLEGLARTRSEMMRRGLTSMPLLPAALERGSVVRCDVLGTKSVCDKRLSSAGENVPRGHNSVKERL